jgi:hypothetical protein
VDGLIFSSCHPEGRDGTGKNQAGAIWIDDGQNDRVFRED